MKKVYGVGEKVKVLDVPLFPVSSTEIRQMIHKGENIAGLVPDAVLRRVEKYSLYR